MKHVTSLIVCPGLAMAIAGGVCAQALVSGTLDIDTGEFIITAEEDFVAWNWNLRARTGSEIRLITDPFFDLTAFDPTAEGLLPTFIDPTPFLDPGQTASTSLDAGDFFGVADVFFAAGSSYNFGSVFHPVDPAPFLSAVPEDLQLRFASGSGLISAFGNVSIIPAPSVAGVMGLVGFSAIRRRRSS